MEFWGVEVKPGEFVKCDPGDLKYLHLSQASLGLRIKDKGAENVLIILKTNDQKLVLGTLSAEKCPQISYDLVFEKEFELSHCSKNTSVYFCGYKTVIHDAFGPEDDVSDEFDSEDEEEMENVKIINGKVNANGKQGKPAPGKAVAAAAKPKAKTEESVKAAKPKAKTEESVKAAKRMVDNDDEDEDDDEDEEEDGSDEVSDEDEDMDDSDDEDEDDDEDSEEEDEAKLKKAENGKKRQANSASKTPGPAKKVKVEKTGADGKKGGATPTRAIQVGKIPAGSDKLKQQTPKSAGSVSCKSCSKTFGSENALQAHAKAKHSDGK